MQPLHSGEDVSLGRSPPGLARLQHSPLSQSPDVHCTKQTAKSLIKKTARSLAPNSLFDSIRFRANRLGVSTSIVGVGLDIENNQEDRRH